MAKWLSKSDYTHGFLISPALLWLKKHQPERLPEVDEATQGRFDMGNRVTEVARLAFPGGSLVTGMGFDSLTNTDKLISGAKDGTIVYEPAAIADGRLYARADIIKKNGDVWDMYEVKSATGHAHHPEYLIDLAFQRMVWERAGTRVGRIYLVLINSHYTRKTEDRGLSPDGVDPQKLVYTIDVTDAIPELIPRLEADVVAALKVIDSPSCPNLDPLKCSNLRSWLPIYKHLEGELPETSIYNLAYVAGGVARELAAAGISDITAIDDPERFKLSPSQRGQWEALRAGAPIVQRSKIATKLAKLRFPLYFLDYETVGPAIPLYDGTRPYQIIPFQYSLQIIDEPGGKPRELRYLHKGSDNPMPALIEHLKSDIGESGSVLTWSGYERDCHNAMEAHYPDSKPFFEMLNRRLFDLMQIFKQQYYIDHRFLGSASIKNVLPVLAPELSYKNLNIGEGQTASNRFAQTVTGQISGAEAKQIFADLEVYCAQDTMAMVKIYQHLVSVVNLNTQSSLPI